MEKLEERKMHLDYLRIIAIICPIIGHFITINSKNTSINSVHWLIANVIDNLLRWCIPVFVMISGALFLDQNKEINIKTLYKKNILRLFTALIFWSLFYAIAIELLLHPISDKTVTNMITSFFNGRYHLWFMPIIIGVYTIIPFLRKICEDKKTEQYFIIINFIFISFIPLIQSLLTFFKIDYQSIFNLKIPAITGYMSYFVLGHYLNTYDISKNKEKIIYALGIAGYIFTVVGTYFLSSYKGTYVDILRKELMATVYFFAVAIFVFFKQHVSKIKTSQKFKVRVIKISKLTFGVYLIHEFIRTVFLDMGLLTTNNITLFFPLFTLACFLISLGITYIISKIPILNKYII